MWQCIFRTVRPEEVYPTPSLKQLSLKSNIFISLSVILLMLTRADQRVRYFQIRANSFYVF